MSGPGEDGTNSNGVPAAPPDGSGVLANLPRTRPQRSSARRDAARRTRLEAERTTQENGPGRARKPASRSSAAKARSGEAAAATKAGLDRRAKPRPDRPATRAKRSSRIRAVEEPVPKQGFECEDERATGSVQPPGGTELIASAAEMVGEVAKAGIATGERLLRDVISLLPRS